MIMVLNESIIGNRYIIKNLKTDLIGEGGMGQVYYGVDTQNNQPVAIKVLKAAHLNQDNAVIERFQQEGKVLRQLNHPNIVRWLDMVEEGTHYYLIMEYISGGSLKTLISEQGNLSYSRLLNIALELADAITRAHHLNVIHRDLKPGNVLLASDDTPRLADFGLAQLETQHNPLTQSGAIIGTVDYLSPEAINGETVDRRSDIWAFGVLLYQMVTGQLPFKRETVVATINAILADSPFELKKYRFDVSDGLRDLIYRMLEKDPKQRIPSVRLIGAEIEHLLDSQTNAKLTKTSSPLQKSKQRPWEELGIYDQNNTQKHNLPIQVTPFVGREKELALLSTQLKQADIRLITILGPGGMGKTRLTQELGSRQLKQFPDGVYFVSLAPLSDPESIVMAIIEAINLPLYQQNDLEKLLLNYLQAKTILLLMDNFEHLLGGVTMLSNILQTAPNVKIIATSRERLNVSGEHIFPLQGLDFAKLIPASMNTETLTLNKAYPAVQLFVNCAKRVNPHFNLLDADLPHLIKLCQWVQGMPLAILLAASWAEMLTLSEIVTELKQSLDFLESDGTALPIRQQSIRVVFDYSWQQLSANEQTVFQQLSIFQGGFNRDAGQAITGATLRDLMGLVNKSFLYRLPTGRYHIHELMRQYAAEKLAKDPAKAKDVENKHSHYYLNLINAQTQYLRGAKQQLTLAKLNADEKNIRLAWRWAVEQEQINLLIHAIRGLHHFYEIQGRYQERYLQLKRSYETLFPSHISLDTLTVDKLHLMAKLLQEQSGYKIESLEHRKELCQQSLSLLAHPSLNNYDIRFEKANALRIMGLLSFQDNREQAFNYLSESLELFKDINAKWEISNVLSLLGVGFASFGKYNKAKHYFIESLTLLKKLDEKILMGTIFVHLGFLAAQTGNLTESEKFFEKGFRIVKELGNEFYLSYQYNSFGWLLYTYFGQFTKAETLFKQSLAFYQNLGSDWILLSLINICHVKLHQGDYQQAHKYAQKRLSLAQSSNINFRIGDAFCLQGYIKLAEQSYSQARENFLTALTHLDDGILLVKYWSLAWLGYLAYKERNISEGQSYLLKALHQTNTFKSDLLAIMVTLTATALSLAELGYLEKAVELYELALQKPLVANSQWFYDVVGEPIARLTASLGSDVIAAAKERGKNKDLDATLEELISYISSLSVDE